MEIVLSEQAQKDIQYWKKTKNIKIQNRITELKNAIISKPISGNWESRTAKTSIIRQMVSKNRQDKPFCLPYRKWRTPYL